MKTITVTIALIYGMLFYTCTPPPIPKLCFETQNTEALTVIFTINCSVGAFSPSLWDFGDGNTSIDGKPIHVYDRSGTYNVKLIATVTNSNGDEQQVSTNQMVSVKAYSFTCDCNIGASNQQITYSGTLQEMEERRNNDPFLAGCNCGEIEFK